MSAKALPRVLIIGGGFAGLAAAKALAKAAVEITVIDRRNYHVFQPLLYEVATAALSPADISSPIRTILRDQQNCQVVLAEIERVDVADRRVFVRGGSVAYDYLVLAAGATHAYFGHDQWATIAPGLKGIEDATEMRRRILLAFESAEYEGSDETRRAALTFGIVGAGPTGVELAGAIKEIAGQTLWRDYKHIDTRTTRVLLFEGGPDILPTFPPKLRDRARRDLQRMGVEVHTGARVTNITAEGIFIGEQFFAVRNIFWAAGVQASPLGKTLGAAVDHSGRVIVGPDLTIPGHPEVFVVGDLAAAKSADTGKPVPGVAQGAIQTGRYAGRIIAGETTPGRTAAQRAPFSYWDKGSLAVIGKSKAVADIGKLQISGYFAWIVWACVHITFLIGFRNRLAVLANWFWTWLLNSRDARLITGDAHLDIEAPGAAGFEADEPARSTR